MYNVREASVQIVLGRPSGEWLWVMVNLAVDGDGDEEVHGFHYNRINGGQMTVYDSYDGETLLMFTPDEAEQAWSATERLPYTPMREDADWSICTVGRDVTWEQALEVFSLLPGWVDQYRWGGV